MSNVISINIRLERKIEKLIASLPAKVIERAVADLERYQPLQPS